VGLAGSGVVVDAGGQNDVVEELEISGVGGFGKSIEGGQVGFVAHRQGSLIIKDEPVLLRMGKIAVRKRRI
jgi:hypothetical protein